MNITSIRAFNSMVFPEPAENHSGRFKNLSYSSCEHLWSYVGKITLLTRNLLNAAARSVHIMTIAGKGFPQTIKNFTTRMKLISIISVPFSIGDLSSTIRKIANSFLLRDTEGFALSTLSFTIIAADALDSLQTFINTSLTLSYVNPHLIFPNLGLPLGYGMSFLGVISRTIQVAKAANLYRNICKKIVIGDSLNKDLLLQFLEDSLGIGKELKSLSTLAPEEISEGQKEKMQRIKDKNKADFLRAAPVAAISAIENLMKLLQEISDEKSFDEQKEQILKSLKNIQQHVLKKIRVDSFGIVANLFSFAALIIFTLGSTTPLPFILKSVAFSIRLGALYHQDQPIKLL